MTTEEALAAAQTNDTGADEVITIDNDLRTIIIPASITLLGVVSDENVQTLHFQMPKTYKGLDLSEFAIRINYMNANNVGDTYAVDDSEISGENIVFTWTVGRAACMYKGNTRFIVCLKKKDASGNVLKEFNTSLTSLPVLEGLETTEAVVAENPDIIEQILTKIEKLTQISPEDIASAVSTYMEANPINVPKKLSDLQEDTEHRTATDAEKQAWNSKSDFSGSYSDLDDKPTIPGTIADLEEDTTHRTVTDTEKKTWNSYGARISDIEKNGTGGGIDVDAELKEYMQTVKPNIKKSIINKGGTVEDTDSFSKYADRILNIPNGIYPAETLPFQTILTAQGLQDSVGIKLNWKDVQADGYLILRKENEKPSTSNDGDIAYNGSYLEDGYTDTAVEKGKTYYYRIFCRNSKNQYQSTEDGSIASVNYVDRTGQKAITDLQVGDTIKFGKYGNSDYTWKIVDTLDKGKGYVTVAADQYPMQAQFDAPENASDNPNPATARKSNGNNRWLYSNARQFLNSYGAKNEWYEAQHTYDVKPSYANMDAFLKDFTDYEKAVIVTKTNTCIRDVLDGGGSETMQDKIWLASSFAMGLEVVQPLEDDHIYEAFTDNASRTYQSNYWLRTINGTTSANSVRFVNSGGSLGNSSASNNYGFALRPFCLLPTSTYVQWSESDNAYYFPDDTVRNPV